MRVLWRRYTAPSPTQAPLTAGRAPHKGAPVPGVQTACWAAAAAAPGPPQPTELPQIRPAAPSLLHRAQHMLRSTLGAPRHRLGRAASASTRGLTLAGVQRWASETPLPAKERAQRALAAQKIGEASRRRPDGRLHIMSLDLSGLDALSCLPDGLCVGWDLNLSGCSRLSRLPDDLRVGGKLDCSRCTSLVYIGPHLAVGGDACFDDCRRLVVIPDDTCIGGDLYLNACGELTSLPERLRVGGRLQAMRCRQLATIGHGLWVGGNMDLRFCDRLLELARDMTRIRGHLYLDGCIALRKWPAVLRVEGDLSVVDCASLPALGPNLDVAGSIDARRCMALTGFGPRLQVGQDMDLTGCVTLRALPFDLHRWFVSDSTPTHLLCVAQTGLTQASIALLREHNLPHVRIVSHARAHLGFKSQHAIEQLIAFWRSFAKTPSLRRQGDAIAGWGLATHQMRTLRAFLARLQDTSDYDNRYARSLLADRVLGILEAMHVDMELRSACLDQMHDALSSCDDRISWSLGQIEQMVQVHRASHMPQSHAALVALAKQYMRLEVVHAYAQEVMAAQPEADAIEVLLRFETGVGALVPLPVGNRSMLYGELGCASTNDIIHVAMLAEQRAQDAAATASFLARWSPWQLHLRRVEASAVRFEALAAAQICSAPHEDQCCILTQERWRDLQEPVQIMETAANAVYEMQMLLTWWSAYGTDPLLRKPFELSQLRRVTWAEAGAFGCDATP